jgi:hypothetical protein
MDLLFSGSHDVHPDPREGDGVLQVHLAEGGLLVIRQLGSI